MARITIVSRNFPPLSGGMERLVHQMHQGLLETHEVALLGPHGAEKFVAPGAPVRATAVSPTSVFLLLSLLKGLFWRPTGGKPDIVMGGSGLVGPVVILLAKLSGAKSILLLHGLDIVADSRIYQWLFVPLFKQADLVVCNSKNTARLAVAGGVRQERTVIINPGADLPGDSLSQDDAKRTLGLDGKTLLLSVGRLIPRKGLAEFVDSCFPDLAAANPDMLLLIAGSEPASALNRRGESVLARIEVSIATHDLATRVQILGHADDQKLGVLYAAADVFVFPLIETPGDVEGFGMVAVEAAAYGTPTVAFDCGGVGDAVADGVSGALVSAGDYAEFAAAIERVSRDGLCETAREFAKQFSWDNYGAKIEQCIQKALQ